MSARTAAVAIALLVALGSSTACGAQHPAARHSTSHKASADTAPAAPASPKADNFAPARTPLGAGERVWAAFSHRGLSYDAWWAALEPLLSDVARAEYVYDDPRNLTAMTLTQKIRLAAKAPAEPRFTAEVVVGTSKGLFRLDLERHTLASRWLLYAIKFPPGVG